MLSLLTPNSRFNLSGSAAFGAALAGAVPEVSGYRLNSLLPSSASSPLLPLLSSKLLDVLQLSDAF
jgi:hypothetical protein